MLELTWHEYECCYSWHVEWPVIAIREGNITRRFTIKKWFSREPAINKYTHWNGKVIIWRNFHHMLHRKLSKWQLPVQPVMNDNISVSVLPLRMYQVGICAVWFGTFLICILICLHFPGLIRQTLGIKVLILRMSQHHPPLVLSN